MRRLFTVFHLDSERGLRGGERQLLYLAFYLRAQGHANVIVCRGGSALEQEARRGGLETLNLSFFSEWDPLSAWKLRRAAGVRTRPLLHAHTGHAAALAYLASRLGGPPWVAHRRVDFHLNGGLSRLFKYEAAGRVIAVSDGVRRVLIKDGLEPARVSVVRDCLPRTPEEAEITGCAPIGPVTSQERSDIRARLARQWRLSETCPWIGNLAALVPHKDQRTLLHCVPEVLRDFPRAHFIIIGSGPLEDELKSLAVDLGVMNSVLFTGFSTEPISWLKALDLFALSSWGEGMGSVLLEAMACGLPIVASSAGGIPEVIEDGRTGFLVPPRDPKRLARALTLALRDPQGCARRAAAAAQDLSRFSLTHYGENIAAIYEEISA